MPKGKRARLDKPREWKLSLPSSVAIPVELLLSNPLTGKPAHGARARLITKLLREWLSSQRKEPQE